MPNWPDAASARSTRRSPEPTRTAPGTGATYLDVHRAELRGCLEGLTEEQARRRLVPSEPRLLGLVKHATYAERVWFGEAVTGRPRQEMGLPPNAAGAFTLAGADTIASVRA